MANSLLRQFGAVLKNTFNIVEEILSSTLNIGLYAEMTKQFLSIITILEYTSPQLVFSTVLILSFQADEFRQNLQTEVRLSDSRRAV